MSQQGPRFEVVQRLAVTTIAALTLAAMSGPALADDTPWPTAGWQTSTPEGQGIDPGALAAGHGGQHLEVGEGQRRLIEVERHELGAVPRRGVDGPAQEVERHVLPVRRERRRARLQVGGDARDRQRLFIGLV